MVEIAISGAKVYAEQGVLTESAVAIAGNKIQQIADSKRVDAREKIEFPANYHLIPGLIDLHIHGANGSDVMDGNHDALLTVSKALASEGVTAFLATTMTASIEKISDVLANVHAFIKTKNQGAKVLGVHLEGPFLSPGKVGAQRADKILAPNIDILKTWQKVSGNLIKLVTLAPELENSVEFIHFLRSQNIVASIGHTDATYDQALAAIDAGCTHVTHLFNAMRGLHQREPGVIAAALLAPHVSTELIADGVHLHPAMIELVLKIKNNAVLVTDAMRAQCMPDGVYDLGDQHVDVRQGIARLMDGTLAGSTLTMAGALRNLIKFTRCELADAMKLAAENPAKTLDIFARKGSIKVGKDADLVVLNERLEVVLTMVEGEIVFRK